MFSTQCTSSSAKRKYNRCATSCLARSSAAASPLERASNFLEALYGSEPLPLLQSPVIAQGSIAITDSRGVGAFDGSLSEGVGDYLAATVTNDPAMGPDFFKGSSRPLRHIDPAGGEYRWPEDVIAGDVHHNGHIISGTLWDLRKALMAKVEATAGCAMASGAASRGCYLP